MCPAYPSNYFFNEYSSTLLELEGKDKKSSWFITRNRRFLEPNELGNFKSMMNMSISLARSVRRMHQAGLAHSDLSCNNVLIDPNTGNCVIIDIDTLVVPGVFPPEVAGTRGYIAPEVLATSDLPYGDPEKKLPSTYTDLHALPVLIYQYLLLRHPLIGPKIYSTESAEEDDFLCMGPQATFIEDPYDNSNRRDDMNVTIHELGPVLENLFIKAFVNGLHSPNERPTAMEWEKGLIKTWNLLHPCDNPDCNAKWFVLYDVSKPICPFCGHEADKENILRFHIRSGLRGRSGQWADTGVIDVYDNMPLFRWHLFSNVFPDEKADGSLQAYVYKYHGDWIFVNKKVQGMTSPKGDIVPIGKAMILKDGDIFRTSPKENGVLIEVSEGK